MEDVTHSTETALQQPDVRRSALEWWENLSFGKQREYELKTFAEGGYWEDNDTLEPEDIIKMYKQHCR